MQVRSEQYYNISLPCHGVYGRNCGRGGDSGARSPSLLLEHKKGTILKLFIKKHSGALEFSFFN